MIEINLLPDVKKEFINAQRTRNTVISVAILVSIAAGVVTLLLAATVYGGQTAVMAAQTESIKKKKNERAAKPEIDKYLTVQNQLKNIDALHVAKPLYSQAFGYLQALNPAAPNNITLTTLEIRAEDSRIELAGSARNFEALTVFKTTLESASLSYTTRGSDDVQNTRLFDTLNLVDASLRGTDSSSVVNFVIQLYYPAVIFDGATQNAKIEVPVETTSDAGRNSPTELFGTDPAGAQQ
jgi:Tfp pilus assembly protein PilN